MTRLRLRDPALLDEFFTDAVAAIEQAMKSEGNLGADALADANNAWWSVSAWQERRLMQAYVDTEPHLGISARLDHYCDEATFVDWEQASATRQTGRPAGATSPQTARPPSSRTLQRQTRLVISPRQSSHLPAPPEAASAKSRNGWPRPPAAPVAGCLATDYPMIRARQVRRRCLRVQQLQDAMPGIDKFSPKPRQHRRRNQ